MYTTENYVKWYKLVLRQIACFLPHMEYQFKCACIYNVFTSNQTRKGIKKKEISRMQENKRTPN